MMKNTIQNSFICTGGDKADRLRYLPEGKVEREGLNHKPDNEYIPMDIYVDPKTIKEHFHAAA
mgnify:CR=1 FL=1